MQSYLQRRHIVLGMAASLLSSGIGPRAAAQSSDIPYFRSGRFQFTILEPKLTLPSIILFPLDGKALDLTSLRGGPILLNFWATWCEACRIEMPTLDRLAKEYRYRGLQILAVSEDGAGRKVVQPFIDKFGIRHLKAFLDPHGYVAFHDPENKTNAPFALYGMPITYAIAASGWIVGYMPGAADWNSAAAGRLIEFLRHA